MTALVPLHTVEPATGIEPATY
ncbi:protein of unknown function [Kyrpidia spormannii]|uniref:Uncharacterized protein n=2 Tax=Kyrpidia spormannii TaxID=2055160 RepID=A0ACA8Z8K9_9BACL|nr:protein of unknown function [Kyrpidia spormannii]CAB3392867.1 protein of unknown function [Kyrpidia spormannii]